MDELARAYMPTQTSLKSPFRADGSDRQRDQEFTNGAADNRWNDEDLYTNHSGDPRIGTHGRSYKKHAVLTKSEALKGETTMAQDTPMGGFGTQSESDHPMSGSGTGSSAGAGSEVCPHCGASKNATNNLDQFLGRLGISDDMLDNLKSSMQNIDVEHYLDTARDYLKNRGDKAKSFVKENPGKVAAGVAVLAVGAGLLLSAMNRE